MKWNIPQYRFIFDKYLMFVAKFFLDVASIVAFFEKTPNTWTVLDRNVQYPVNGAVTKQDSPSRSSTDILFAASNAFAPALVTKSFGTFFGVRPEVWPGTANRFINRIFCCIA